MISAEMAKMIKKDRASLLTKGGETWLPFDGRLIGEGRDSFILESREGVGLRIAQVSVKDHYHGVFIKLGAKVDVLGSPACGRS